MDRRRFLQTGTAATVALAAPVGVELGGARRGPDRKHWVWIRGDRPVADWRTVLSTARRAGITAALIDASAESLTQAVEVAAGLGMEVHAWMITMMEGGQEQAHPEWYAVSREGRSTATHPPYVDYYTFMCPTRPAVRQHKADRARQRLAVPGLAGLHLDYIRYPDVILPRALWSVYDIVQDREYAPYDYCYCDVCRETFEARTGIDPLSLQDPSQNAAWLQFRYDTIVEMVNALSQTAHAAGVEVTAAVFPSPLIARRLVRQDWPRWPVDAVFPMVYNGFYDEGVDWIEPTVREGVTALGGRLPLYAGLYVPDLDPAALAEAARRALAGGADGIAVFEGVGTTPEHWAALGAILNNG